MKKKMKEDDRKRDQERKREAIIFDYKSRAKK
jgi:hypothetical protein